MNEPERGMNVLGPSGQLGTVAEVIHEVAGARPRVMVTLANGQSMMLQPGTYQVDNGVLRVSDSVALTGQSSTTMPSAFQSGDIYRTQSLSNLDQIETREVQAGQELVVPVIQEEVVVERREVERGGVRVHKRVEEREEVVEQPTYREEVTVERVALGRPLDQAVGSRQEGDTLIIPVLEEMLVVEKRLVLKEEIRITKRRIEETEQARILLREEHVEVEQLDDPGSVA